MSTTTSESALAATGLTDDQRLHFTEHGWVVLENVLSEAQCSAYIESIDRILAKITKGERSDFWPGDRRNFREPHLSDISFVDLYEIPGVLEAACQLTGLKPSNVRYHNSLASSAWPDPQGVVGRDILTDCESWPWHRDQRPKWNIHTDEDDPRFVTSGIITMATCFTPVAAENGGTAFLDGSHRIDGRWERDVLYRELSDTCPIVHPEADAGSILFFTESLVHCATQLLSDQRRACVFTWIGASWLAMDEGQPPHLVDELADERLKLFFTAPIAGGENN